MRADSSLSLLLKPTTTAKLTATVQARVGAPGYTGLFSGRSGGFRAPAVSWEPRREREVRAAQPLRSGSGAEPTTRNANLQLTLAAGVSVASLSSPSLTPAVRPRRPFGETFQLKGLRLNARREADVPVGERTRGSSVSSLLQRVT